VLVHHEIGIGKDDLIAGVKHREDKQEQRAGYAGTHQTGLRFESRTAREIFHNGGIQFRQTLCGRVFVKTPPNGVNGDILELV